MDNPSVTPQYQPAEPVGFPQASHPNSGKNKKSGVLKWIIIAIVGLIIIGGAAFFVLSGGESEDSSPSPTSSVNFIQTPQPTVVASPTAGPIDREGVSIQVLNGTGIPGEAGALQQVLSSAGYKEIETGNSSSTVTTTTMSYSSSVSQAVVADITKILENTYQKVEARQSSTGNFDVSIVVGLRKGATPRPSTASTPSATTKPTGSPTATSSPSATPQ